MPKKILFDFAKGCARELDGSDDVGELVAHKRDINRFDGDATVGNIFAILNSTA